MGPRVTWNNLRMLASVVEISKICHWYGQLHFPELPLAFAVSRDLNIEILVSQILDSEIPVFNLRIKTKTWRCFFVQRCTKSLRITVHCTSLAERNQMYWSNRRENHCWKSAYRLYGLIRERTSFICKLQKTITKLFPA